ncbi:MAG TPA: hypothetical protein VH142_22110, partial [Polyangiaceae bacterium]|nr:hypothetical protein [Polyangiaceae bacterium]
MRSRIRRMVALPVAAACGLRVAVTVVPLGLAAVLAAPTASAQSADVLEQARTLFREGLSLEAAGDWASALAKFEDVGKVKLTPQVRFHTARCYEHLGRLNEALGAYRLAEYEGGQQNIPELSAITQARQGLEARVPKLVIRRGKGAESARIELDGVALGEAQIGEPVAVDPGPHTVVAKLTGDRQFEQSTNVKESETAEVELVAPDFPAPASAGTSSGDLPNVADTSSGTPHSSALPWVVGGVGVAGLAGSGVFYLLRNSAKNDLDHGCHGNVCPESLKSKQNDGELFTTLSMVSLGVGVVGVGLATYLFISGSHHTEKVATTGVKWDAAI